MCIAGVSRVAAAVENSTALPQKGNGAHHRIVRPSGVTCRLKTGVQKLAHTCSQRSVFTTAKRGGQQAPTGGLQKPPSGAQAADSAASGRLLLLSGSLSLPARHPAHSSAAEGSDQGLPTLHYVARIKVGAERGRGDGAELSCPRVRTSPLRWHSAATSHPRSLIGPILSFLDLSSYVNITTPCHHTYRVPL